MITATLLTVLSSLLLAAHFLRWSQTGLTLICLLTPFLLLSRKRWHNRVVQLILLAGTAEWVRTGVALMQERFAMGEPWGRAGIIMGSVALFSLVAALLLGRKAVAHRYGERIVTARASLAAFLLVAALCSFVALKVSDPVLLLADRFMPGMGFLEIFAIALYAGWLVDLLLNRRNTSPIRLRVWLGFSLVFFAQLLLGLTVSEKFLMTGALHLPVPALIVAGPLFRGAGLFMPILFLASVLLLGPAWCSWLCYIGSWDNAAARATPRPQVTRLRSNLLRGGMLLLVVTALVMRWVGVSVAVAVGAGGAFGIVGVGVMALVSRKRGTMTHCTAYCPIGLLANIVGKVNPFRIRIDASCTDCGVCTRTCRYGALSRDNIRDRKPGLSCSLCGDCLSSCHGNHIGYRFLGLSPERSRGLFVTVAVATHAIFLAFARI